MSKILQLFWRASRVQAKRAALTVAAIAWGSLSLVLLLGFGDGLSYQLDLAGAGLGRDIAIFWPGETTKPWEGLPAGREIRPAHTGPVFSVEKATGSLHMRYTTRTRSIAWKDDANLHKAVGFIRELLDSESRWIFRYRLQAGEGIICNNVLHAREAFRDEGDTTRLLYRARYHDRIAGTEMKTDTAGDIDAVVE